MKYRNEIQQSQRIAEAENATYRREVEESQRIVEAENARQSLALAVATIGLTVLFYSKPEPGLGPCEGYFVGAGLVFTVISVVATYLSMYASVRTHKLIVKSIDAGNSEEDSVSVCWRQVTLFLSASGMTSFVTGALILFACVFKRIFQL